MIAEISANHGKSLNKAKNCIREAALAGADAVKFQTYTPDTLSIDCKKERFYFKEGIWCGQYQYNLYQNAYMPWEWHKPLSSYAQEMGITFFSTPFDLTAVDFLEAEINPPCYKISSFDVVHHPLLKAVAATRKPILMSTGMASVGELDEAVSILKEYGAKFVVLLKCVSMYPAATNECNLNSITSLLDRYNCLVGLSDHTMDSEVCLGAVALGASVIEKHFVLDKDPLAIDGAFSLRPKAFKDMSESVRRLHVALGQKRIGVPISGEQVERKFRRSIFACKNIKKGDLFTPKNIRIVKMADGLSPKYWEDILGTPCGADVEMGDPILLSHCDICVKESLVV